MNTADDSLQNIARWDGAVFLIKRAWVFTFWDEVLADPDMPKRDSPEAWCAAADRGELFALGARVWIVDTLRS